MYEKEIRLPKTVRQIGEITGNNRVYIEDYAYGYLHTLKEQAKDTPIRAALYGNNFFRDDMNFYLIYGVIRIEEGEAGRDMSETALLRDESFFAEYELIGYVNLRQKEKTSAEKEGCYVFYEANEAMQDYLLAEQDKHWIENKHPKQLAGEAGKGLLFKKIVQKLMLGMIILVTAVATAAINHYDRMCEFAIMAARAAQAVR